MGREDAPDGSNLPAPYRNPWAQLADDLRAALADLRLRCQELLRRNSEGSLWRVGWWPRDLAPLFWPLLLLLLLGLTSGSAVALRAFLATRPPALASMPVADADAAPLTAAPPTAPSPPAAGAPASPLPGVPAAPANAPAPAAAAPNPLSPLLDTADAQGLVLAAAQQPEQSLVVLQLTPAFAALAAAERQRRAEHWQELASELGYEHLELRDQRAGLLGRDALVGAGMILFSTPPPA